MDARKFILNSDHQIEKIIYQKTGVLNAITDTIVNELGQPFLPDGFWGHNPDFSDAQPFMSYKYVNQAQSFSNYYYLSCQVNKSSISLNIQVSSAFSVPLPIYYYIIGYVSPETVGMPAPVVDTTGFKFNTDFQYRSVFLEVEGVVPYGPSPVLVNHGLGYIPQVSSWVMAYNGSDVTYYTSNFYQTSGALPGSPDGSEVGVSVNNNDLILMAKAPGSGARRSLIRAYTNE